MSPIHLALSLALAMTASACVTAPERPGDDPSGDDPQPGGDDPGGDDPTPPPGDPIDPAVRALFDDGVAAVVQAKCAGCHGGPGTSPLKFVPTDLAAMYDTVTSYTQLVGGYDAASAAL
jgi:cytochrome c553